MVSTPTCGACFGGRSGILAAGEGAVTTTNRNFRGRMGSPEAEVYLANAWVAAAAAVAGEIVDPADVLGERRVIIEGRAVVIPGDDVDTDVMYPGQYLNIDDPEQMGTHLFEGFDPSLRDQLGADTILVAGAELRHRLLARARAAGDEGVGRAVPWSARASRASSTATASTSACCVLEAPEAAGRRTARLADPDRHRQPARSTSTARRSHAARCRRSSRAPVLRRPRALGERELRAVDVIVRDLGDAWQIVLQTDHADLSAAFARAGRRRSPSSDSLKIATERHDDGWAVWEQSPRVDDDGKPVNFLEVDVRSHLAFYRAGIAAITEQDAHAGLLVSMHGAGIYRQRYGLDPGLGLTRAAEVQERGGGVRRRAGGEVRRRPGRAPRRLRAAPALRPPLAVLLHARRGGGRGGRAPGLWPRARRPVARSHHPYPFGEAPARFSLVRRVLPKARARYDVLGTPPEQVAITLEA